MNESHDADAPSAQHADAPAPPRPQRVDGIKETRVSTVIGDRLCVKCGFNLTGQPVYKESRYELFIARCPECGAVASMQEYPVLGKWANRWASLAAALWLLLLLGGGFVFAMSTFGVSLGCVQSGSDTFAEYIANRALDENSVTGNSYGGYSVIESSWWRSQRPWRLLRDAGGFRRVVADESVAFWFALGVAGLAFGVIGSVALLHASRLRAAIALALPLVLTIAFQTITHVGTARGLTFNINISAFEAAVAALGPAVFAISDLSAYFGILIGVIVGRPLARFLVRTMLPPRMRSTMSFLWLTDGKRPPTSRR